MCVLVQLSEQENDAVDLAEALEAVVVGNHVDPKASYCNKTFRRRQWLHKLLVYGELVQDGMSQCCQPTLQSNFTRVAYDAQQLRWHEEAGLEKEDEWKKFIALYVRMKQQFALTY